MEDDEDIQSQQSGEAASESPSHPNGRRITMSSPPVAVTVAAAPPQPPSQQQTLTLALPIQQQQRTAGNGGGGGREDCWSEGATSTLIDAWGERYLELSRGNLKQQHWKEVADIVSSREDYTKPSKTDVQCKNRIDTLKKKYKLEKNKMASNGGPSNWPFFHRLDRLIGPTSKIKIASFNSSPVVASSTRAQKVPVGIPVGVRTFHQFQPQDKHKQKQKLKQKQFRGRGSSNSEAEEEDSQESSDSFPPPTINRKRPRFGTESYSNPPQSGVFPSKEAPGRGNSVRQLTRAILQFGEAYERAESSKLQQVVEMEKQRLKFAKELELQRMQFFMKTQLELTQLKHRRKTGTNRHNNDNNSDNSG